jgi:4-diphosphocytidyl-2-C-methyl-D-erythritol kinase
MRLQARAYAKINWILDVGALRADGYHELSTLFQTIDLYDELDIEPADHLSLEIIGAAGALPADETNLVMRAARALQHILIDKSQTPRALGAHIKLNKKIPMAAGLGGGSADAAAALIALNQLWQADLTRHQLAELGAQLGSDVPFFFTGGSAWGSGRGIEIAPIDDIAAPYLLLVNPGVAVSTAAVYREFDRLTNVETAPILKTCSFLTADMLFAQARNSLASVAATLCPVIACVEEKLKELSGQPVLMSGSGATVWARFLTAAQLQSAAEALKPSGWLIIKTAALARDEYWRSIVTTVA